MQEIENGPSYNLLNMIPFGSLAPGLRSHTWKAVNLANVAYILPVGVGSSILFLGELVIIVIDNSRDKESLFLCLK